MLGGNRRPPAAGLPWVLTGGVPSRGESEPEHLCGALPGWDSCAPASGHPGARGVGVPSCAFSPAVPVPHADSYLFPFII